MYRNDILTTSKRFMHGCSRDQTFRDKNQDHKIFSRPRQRPVFFETFANDRDRR